MSQDDEKRQIEIMQKAIELWLDKKFAEFGRWSLYGILAAGFAAWIYFIMMVDRGK